MPDLQDVAQQVEALYSASDPQTINALQKQLQSLQRSPLGYCMAQRLLHEKSPRCRYFGALTFAVVIQTSAFTQDSFRPLLAELLAKIRQFASLSGHSFVVRKLLSDVALLYLKTYEFFESPVAAVVAMVRSASPDMTSDLPDLTSSPDVTAPSAYDGLAHDQWHVILSFATVLVEDVARLNDLRAPVHAHVRRKVYPCVQAAIAAVDSAVGAVDPALGAAAVDCVAAWMAYVPDVAGDIRYDDIHVFSAFLLGQLLQPNSQTAPRCLSVFNDILELNPTLLPANDKKVLYEHVCGTWGQHYVQDAADPAPFVDLFLTILQLSAVRLAKTLSSPDTMDVLSFALRLSDFPGTPCIDDTVSERMILFWEDFAAVFEDSPDTFAELERADEAYGAQRNALFTRVSQIYWAKAHLPDYATYSDIFHEFNGYRSNVSDFFIVLYSLLKLDLYETMLDSLTNTAFSDPKTDFSGVDATLYLLYKINEDSVYFESQAAPLARLTLRLFSSPFVVGLQAVLAASSHEMTPYYLSTFVKYVSSTEFFLKTEAGRPFLAPVVAMLLPIVQAVPAPHQLSHASMALLASKSLTKICDECSPHLVGLLPDLEAVVVQMLNEPAYDSLVRSRMFNAYSMVAHNIADLGQYAEVLRSMISAIAAAAADTLKASELGDMQQDYVISLLSCLVNIAKGSAQADDTEEQMSDAQKEQHRAFWAADPAGIKPLLASIVHEFSFRYPEAGRALVIEKCTQIMKVGLGESLGGPFEVGSQAIADYCISVMQVLAQDGAPQIVAIPHVYGLMQRLIGTEFRQLSPESVHVLMHRTVTEKLDVVRQDPDLVRAAVDVCRTIVDKRPGLLLFSPDFSALLQFSLAALHAPEAAVVKAASKLWYSLLVLKKGTQEDGQFLTQMFVEHGVGQVLTQNLVQSFVHAPRSNLEHFYQTFRGLIGKYSAQAKTWMAHAVDGDIAAKLGEKNASLFIHKLLVTRGRRTANDVLRVFWLESNGMIDYNSRPA